MLTFLESHFQHYIDILDDSFCLVFHGFEQDDAKDTREDVEAKLKTFKSLNDVRRENDMDEYDAKWANVPGLQNPQYLQAHQAEAMAEQEGGEEGFDEGEENFFEKSMKEKVVKIKI